MPQSYTNLQYHIVFGVKDRQPLITDDIKPRTIGYIAGIINSEKGITIAINAMSDHIHILAILPRDRSISDMMRDIKSHSSMWIRKTFPKSRNFAWQAGYAAFSISYAGTGKVKEYINNQEEHHKVISFRDEYIAFLRTHDMEFDEGAI